MPIGDGGRAISADRRGRRSVASEIAPERQTVCGSSPLFGVVSGPTRDRGLTIFVRARGPRDARMSAVPFVVGPSLAAPRHPGSQGGGGDLTHGGFPWAQKLSCPRARCSWGCSVGEDN